MRSNAARAPDTMSEFFSPYRHQFVRVGVCVPPVAVAEPAKNGDQVLDLVTAGDSAKIAPVGFSPLCPSGHAIDDLLFPDAVLHAGPAHGDRLFASPKRLPPAVCGGAP